MLFEFRQTHLGLKRDNLKQWNLPTDSESERGEIKMGAYIYLYTVISGPGLLIPVDVKLTIPLIPSLNKKDAFQIYIKQAF